MKKLHLTVLVIILSVLFTNCTSEFYEPLDSLEEIQETSDEITDDTVVPDNTGDTADTGENTDSTDNNTDSADNGDNPFDGMVTYYGDVEPILNQLCIACHGPVDPEDHFDISTYEKAKDEIEDIIKEIEEDGDDIMPPSGRMGENLIQLIKDWETDGLLDGDPNAADDSGNTSGYYTYVADIQPILNQECTACHGTTNPAGGLDISTFALTISNIDILIARIDLQTGQNGIMPTNGRMDEIKIQKIKEWNALGLPEQ